MKKSHTALFIAPTGVGKTHLVFDVLETESKLRNWIWADPEVILIEPRNSLYNWIEKIGNLLAGSKILFLIDDIIVDETLNKQRQPLLELVISGRHKKHLIWLLTQLYTAISKNIRRQAKMLYVWYPKNRTDLNIIH